MGNRTRMATPAADWPPGSSVCGGYRWRQNGGGMTVELHNMLQLYVAIA